MESKLQELTQKIYSEGIEKAKADAESIVQEAHKSAEIIIRKAQQEASEILLKANGNATELKRNAESEIRMASRQSISKLKQQITDIITAKVIDAPVKEAMKDKEFVGSVILKVASAFNNNVDLVLPNADKDQLARYFNDRTLTELNKSIEISFDGNIKSGFKISPKGENYTVSFTDEDFAGYFKGFMRPATIQLVFGEE